VRLSHSSTAALLANMRSSVLTRPRPKVWRRDKMRRECERCVQHQQRYDEAFEPGLPAQALRHRPVQCCRAAQTDRVPVGRFDGHVIVPMEEKLFRALREEVEKPTGWRALKFALR